MYVWIRLDAHWYPAQHLPGLKEYVIPGSEVPIPEDMVSEIGSKINRATAFEDVGEFHRRFELPHYGDGSPPALLAEDVFEFRRKFLQEELDELIAAHAAGDLPGFVDALVDLIYVANGTGHLAGVDLDAHHAIVQAANMKKERVPSADASKRGHRFDVRKPFGWVAPDHEPLLRSAGWKPR